MDWNERYAAKTREEALDQATKLHTLATSPSAQPGESVNAATMRDKLMKQHGINIDEINGTQERQQKSRNNQSRRPYNNPSGFESREPNPGGFGFGTRGPYMSDHDLESFVHKTYRDAHNIIRQQKINMGQPDIGEYEPETSIINDDKAMNKHNKEYEGFFNRSKSTLRQTQPGTPEYSRALYWHMKRTPSANGVSRAESYRSDIESTFPGTVDWDTPTTVPGASSVPGKNKRSWFKS